MPAPAIVLAARGLLGTPFLHQGRSRLGADCAGMVILCERELGSDPPDVAGYGKSPWKDGLREAMEAFYGPARTDGPFVGDRVLMRFRREPQHVAIVGDYFAGGLSLIHCHSGVGVVTEHRLSGSRWERFIVGIYRP